MNSPLNPSNEDQLQGQEVSVESTKSVNVRDQIEVQETGKVNSKRVALLVDTSSEWGRNLVKGVSGYAVKHGPWNLWIESRGPIRSGTSNELSLPANWNGNGIITPSIEPDVLAALSRYQCPVVSVAHSPLNPQTRIPCVISDVKAVGEMALAHFVHRGVKNFAYVGPLECQNVHAHAKAFESAVINANGQCEVLDNPKTLTWSQRRERLCQWLRNLDRATGVFTWDTPTAIEMIDVCNCNNISIPDDLLVLAGDDDELLCNTTTPTLSGVVTASEQIGYSAAKSLDAAMRGEPQELVQMVSPIMVNLRQSTDSLAITDPDLLAAVRFIRNNACRGITVQQVADSVPIGRRSLERKFKDCFARTPLDEIQRLRLIRVRELLVKTDLPISKIAEEAGFGTPEYMTTMFKCRFGLTPLKFRSYSRAR